jgi:hypothetical protein
MRHHIDGMHTTIQRLETCTNQVVDRTHEINEILGPNRQKITRCSMNYELLRKVRRKRVTHYLEMNMRYRSIPFVGIF